MGRFKAAFFFTLGYSGERWRTLRRDLLRHAADNEAIPTEHNSYGQKYEIRGRIEGPTGRAATWVAVWIILQEEEFPPLRDRIPWSTIMRFKELQTVVLNRDLPDHGLQKGDLGAVVHIYEPDGLEVEFVRASGRTEALVTLNECDVRSVEDADLIAVRQLDRTA